MTVQKLKREIKELKNSIIGQYEPKFKIFVFRVNGLTNEGKTEEEINAYIAANPHTRVLKLFRKSCRKAL